MDSGFGQRLFDFAVRVLEYCRELPKTTEFHIIKYQLIKSATSGGANYEEAQGAISKADFVNKINIALKEIREANYWIKILLKVHKSDENLKSIMDESEELKKILGAIYSKSSRVSN